MSSHKKPEINVPVLAIGCGQGGSNLVAAGSKLSIFENVAGINTTTSDEMLVPESNQIHCPNPDNPKRGAGKDARKGAELFMDNLDEVKRRLGLIFGKNSADALYLISTSLGGGSGNGMSPLLARILRKATEQPILGFMTLPEDSFLEPLAARNVLVGLEEIKSNKTFDQLFVIDNNKVYERVTPKESLAKINELVWSPIQHTLSYVGRKSTATMDVEDFEALMKMGRCAAVYETEIPESAATSAEQLREHMMRSWKNDQHFYCSEHSDPDRLMNDGYLYGFGLLIGCPPDRFDKYRALFEAFYGDISRLLNTARNYRGFVADESLVDTIRIITIVSGLPYPRQRIQEITEKFQEGSRAAVDDTPSFLAGLDRRALAGQPPIQHVSTESFSILSLVDEEPAATKEDDPLLGSPLLSRPTNKPTKKKGLNFG